MNNSLEIRVKQYRFYVSCSFFKLRKYNTLHLIFLRIKTKYLILWNIFSWLWYSTEGFYPSANFYFMINQCFSILFKVTTKAMFMPLKVSINQCFLKLNNFLLKGLFWSGDLLNVNHGVEVGSLLTNIKLSTAETHLPFLF